MLVFQVFIEAHDFFVNSNWDRTKRFFSSIWKGLCILRKGFATFVLAGVALLLVLSAIRARIGSRQLYCCIVHIIRKLVQIPLIPPSRNESCPTVGWSLIWQEYRKKLPQFQFKLTAVVTIACTPCSTLQLTLNSKLQQMADLDYKTLYLVLLDSQTCAYLVFN